ncbi:unnamed protein product [Adineta ricciae]|uniref:G-protein coupled receptors family 1 profile domain-containing protein n=2 Tax=Adineta ricciae TaxID=249248 RepID=A0A814FUS6_ADIRI|nr:unnamed protein product [Adineta ricciae]
MASSTSADFLLPESEYLPQWLLMPYLIISIIESLIGTIGNLFVIVIILFFTKPNIPQTSHNCFIVNLALSDFVLCLFTMPLNTYRSLNIYMTFPRAFCKLADSFPAINIYVSSLTIVTISIYRYLVVCYPYKKIIGPCSTIIIMISIWVLAIGAASPLFIYSRSIPAYDDDIINSMVELMCTQPLNTSCVAKYTKMYRRLHICHESWPQHGNLHALYTIFMLFLQFILPILIICLTYYQVMLKLRERFRYRFLMKRHNIGSLQHEVRRQRRNNVLLLLIVTLYAISWLPFNISYILFTYGERYELSDTIQSTRDQLSKYLPLRFLICMISAISNPFLYSYFNETFKDGLKRIFSFCYPRLNQGLIRKSIDQTDYSRTRETFSNSIKSSGVLNHANNYPISAKSTSFGTPHCSLSESANL